ncbi:MAG: lipocalin-like domain-containing protein [Syntrophobacteraceae bacterium]
MADITKLIVGAWRLVRLISIDSDGKKEYPFGEDAVGYIHYSDTGIMAVQISRKSRGEAKDLSRRKNDYLAYFGRYEVDTAKQVVRHFVEGQLFPGDHPEVLERKYRFEGDLMSLKPLDGTNREILWRRWFRQLDLAHFDIFIWPTPKPVFQIRFIKPNDPHFGVSASGSPKTSC